MSVSTPCPPLTDEQWPTELADMRGSFAATLNVYRTMAHHPALLRAWAPLRQHIVKDSALGPERSELVILRAAHRMGSSYEWSQHVHRARQIGLSNARIQSMKGMPDGEDGMIAAAVDMLLDQHRLPTDFERELAAVIGRTAVIDLMATVGFYSILGYMLMTYETPLDSDIPPSV